jgi:hypothetical protein
MRYDPQVTARFRFVLATSLAVSAGSLAALSGARAEEPDEPFTMQQIASDGRTVAAELGDFDGDGTTDLLQIVFKGVPPDEQRVIRLWKQQGEEHELASAPSVELPVPSDSAAYDVGDALPERPGLELVLLRPKGLTIVAFGASGAQLRDVTVDGPTVAPAEDERGLDRLHLVYSDFGDSPWLMVPMIAQTEFRAADGSLRARLDVGARANYFMPQRPGPMLVDSDIQLLLDVPRISVADVDGDGKADVVGSSRHDLRVFLRRPDGSFAVEPDRDLKLALISEKDHIRGYGAVRVEVRDVSGDGKADLLISTLAGGISDATSTTRIHLNRGGTWNLAKPDFTCEPRSGWGADQLIDIDHDGKPELMHVAVAFGVLDLIQALVTRAIDAEVTVYRADASGVFAKEPWFKRKLNIAISFDTGRPLGFVPTGSFDLNGDGYDDLVTPGRGDRIDVYLGSANGIADAQSGRQAVPTSGRVRGGDWNGDGLEDLLLYDPRLSGGAVRIATNRGVLPGTLPSVAAPKKLRKP